MKYFFDNHIFKLFFGFFAFALVNQFIIKLGLKIDVPVLIYGSIFLFCTYGLFLLYGIFKTDRI